MKRLEYLFIHCSATPEGRPVSRKDLERWHLVERGWSRLGYSDIVHIDGSLENLIPFNQDNFVDNWEISNGAKGYNGKARHVMYVGGTSKTKMFWQKFYPPKDTRTEAQKETLLIYVKYMIKRHPHIKVGGHNQVANKACPSFDVPTWLRANGIPEKNILK